MIMHAPVFSEYCFGICTIAFLQKIGSVKQNIIFEIMRFIYQFKRMGRFLGRVWQVCKCTSPKNNT